MLKFFLLVFAAFNFSFGDSQREIENLENLGYQLYVRDYYSALAQELILKHKSYNKILDTNHSGYICFISNGICYVKWIEKTEENYSIIAQYQFDLTNGDFKGPILEKGKVLSDIETQIYLAQKSALNSIKDSALCSNHYNSVVFPPEQEGEEWDVYLLPASMDSEIILAEGAYRISLLGAGLYPDLIQRLSIECIYLKRKESRHTLYQYLTEFPTEYHVYISLFYGISLEVITGDIKWLVEEGKIKKL